MTTDAGRRRIAEVAAGVPTSKRVTLAMTQLAAPAGGTGADAGCYDTAENRDLFIASLNALRTDIAAIRTVLVNLGIIA